MLLRESWQAEGSEAAPLAPLVQKQDGSLTTLARRVLTLQITAHQAAEAWLLPSVSRFQAAEECCLQLALAPSGQAQPRGLPVCCLLRIQALLLSLACSVLLGLQHKHCSALQPQSCSWLGSTPCSAGQCALCKHMWT